MDLSKYERGRFNGVPFFTPSSSITWGQKTIIHTYPKSNRAEVEFLGLSKRQFSIECVIYGNNYKELRKQFETQLNKQSYGSLIHPIDGQINVAVLQGWTVSQSESDLGIATYSVTFQEISDGNAPDRAETFAGKILEKINQMVKGSEEYFLDLYKTTFPSSLTSGSSSVESLSKSVRDLSSKLMGEAEDINTLFAFLDEVEADPLAIAKDPDSYVNAISKMLNNMSFLGSAEKSFNSFKKLFDEGDDLLQNNILTVVEQEVDQNTKASNNTTQLQALLYAYNTTLDINFLTFDELREKQSLLEAQYQKLLPKLNGELRNDLDLLRSNVNAYYLSLNLYDIIEIQALGQSLNVLCYQYYGNLDFKEQIKALNNITNEAFVQGTIRILNNDSF